MPEPEFSGLNVFQDLSPDNFVLENITRSGAGAKPSVSQKYFLKSSKKLPFLAK
jgi:hypothetical protein